MKKFLPIIILCVLLASASPVAALSYTESLFVSESHNSIKQSQISEAKLLDSYVERYIEKINHLHKSYSQDSSPIIDEANSLLSNMSKALVIIQEGYVENKNATEVMKKIVHDLKIINSRMQIYLEQKKELYKDQIEARQLKYVRVGFKISSILDRLIDEISGLLSRKENLNSKEKDIVRTLVALRDKNNQIKEFKSLSFSTEEEMKTYFRKIIEGIRNDILVIKKLSRGS